jgi:hypothetical protein
MEAVIWTTNLHLDYIGLIWYRLYRSAMNKYPQYHTNPDDIIGLTIYNSINGRSLVHHAAVDAKLYNSIDGDDTLLDELEQSRRTIDSLAKY